MDPIQQAIQNMEKVLKVVQDNLRIEQISISWIMMGGTPHPNVTIKMYEVRSE